MKFKPGLRLKSKTSKKIIILKRKASGNGHWNCDCGSKNHMIHEGTLRRFYEEITP